MRTVLDEIHPAISTSYYSGLFILVILFTQPVIILTELLLLLLLNILQGNTEKVKKMFKQSWILLLAIILFNGLLNHRGTYFLFYLGANPVTLEAVLYGLLMTVVYLNLMLIFISYNQVITAHKFLYLFSRISPQLTLLTMITIRFVPLFLRRLTTITRVQKTRGIQMETGKLRERAKNGMKLVQVLLICSLEEALQTADSMEGRGYGVAKRTSYLRYFMEVRDWLIGVIGGTLFITIISWKIKGIGVYSVYTSFSNWGFTTLNEWFLFIFISLFIGIPLFLEGRERIWWRWLKHDN